MTTTTSIVPSSMKTLLEPNDIGILPQHRLKVAKTNLIPAICFYNGTFVPIHAGHISVLKDAKHYIDNLGTHELLAAYISPSHSGYVAKKLNPEELIGAGHRLSMIYLAIENLDWVMVDLFEMFQPCRTSLSIVMEGFISRVRSQLPDGAQIDVFWLKGEDALFHKKSPDNLIQLGFHSIYVLNRGCNDNIISTNNQFKSIQDYHEKRWQEIRTLSSFPEKYSR
jgi:nicotinic acid mononucleotide adenylyltransferase